MEKKNNLENSKDNDFLDTMFDIENKEDEDKEDKEDNFDEMYDNEINAKLKQNPSFYPDEIFALYGITNKKEKPENKENKELQETKKIKQTQSKKTETIKPSLNSHFNPSSNFVYPHLQNLPNHSFFYDVGVLYSCLKLGANFIAKIYKSIVRFGFSELLNDFHKTLKDRFFFLFNSTDFIQFYKQTNLYNLQISTYILLNQNMKQEFKNVPIDDLIKTYDFNDFKNFKNLFDTQLKNANSNNFIISNHFTSINIPLELKKLYLKAIKVLLLIYNFLTQTNKAFIKPDFVIYELKNDEITINNFFALLEKFWDYYNEFSFLKSSLQASNIKQFILRQKGADLKLYDTNLKNDKQNPFKIKRIQLNLNEGIIKELENKELWE